MPSDRHEWICKRAYAIWEDAGRPDGHDREHWSQAVDEFELLERTRASLDGSEVMQLLGKTTLASRERELPQTK